MKYYTRDIKTNTSIDSILKSLKSMVYESTNDFFVFPFCLFQKRFYSSLRNNRNSIFTGKISERCFKFNRAIRYGNVSTGSRVREIKIKGEIKKEENSTTISLEFHSPQNELLIESIIIIAP